MGQIHLDPCGSSLGQGLVAGREGHTFHTVWSNRVPVLAKEQVLGWTRVKLRLNFEMNHTWTHLDQHTGLLTSSFNIDVCRDHILLPKATVGHLPAIKQTNKTTLNQFNCRNSIDGFRHICPPEKMFSQEWWQKTSLYTSCKADWRTYCQQPFVVMAVMHRA